MTYTWSDTAAAVVKVCFAFNEDEDEEGSNPFEG